MIKKKIRYTHKYNVALTQNVCCLIQSSERRYEKDRKSDRGKAFGCWV